jgi:hypothetical protein
MSCCTERRRIETIHESHRWVIPHSFLGRHHGASTRQVNAIHQTCVLRKAAHPATLLYSPTQRAYWCVLVKSCVSTGSNYLVRSDLIRHCTVPNNALLKYNVSSISRIKYGLSLRSTHLKHTQSLAARLSGQRL